MCAINFTTLSLYHLIHLFSIFFLHLFKLSSRYCIKKKTFILSINSHLLFHSSSNISPPSLPVYLPTTTFSKKKKKNLPTTIYFTIKLPLSFPLSYIWTLLLSILFCINLISFFPFNPYFSHTKTVSNLSLYQNKIYMATNSNAFTNCLNNNLLLSPFFIL